MSKTKFKYALTGRYGATLYEALRERDFDDYEAREVGYLIEASKIGGGDREHFVSWLEAELSYSKWADYSKKAEVPSHKMSDWLMTNELPNDEGELELRKRYAQEEANIAYDGVIGQNNDDDIETAYTFGFVKFTDLPQDVQRKIKFLCDRARERDKRIPKEHNTAGISEYYSEITSNIRNSASRLEKDACQRLILVSGFYCDIHDGNAAYKEPIPRSEVLTCPSCGHPICPVCANCFPEGPEDVDEAREYVASCESVSGHAYCGDCGDYSVEFMLRFLRLIGCPIPPECEDFKPIPREAKFYMTATIDALPNKDGILQTAITEFNKGTTGIIKIPDVTGEIWAVPERHPDGWIVTILYPEQR